MVSLPKTFENVSQKESWSLGNWNETEAARVACPFILIRAGPGLREGSSLSRSSRSMRASQNHEHAEVRDDEGQSAFNVQHHNPK